MLRLGVVNWTAESDLWTTTGAGVGARGDGGAAVCAGDGVADVAETVVDGCAAGEVAASERHDAVAARDINPTRTATHLFKTRIRPCYQSRRAQSGIPYEVVGTVDVSRHRGHFEQHTGRDRAAVILGR